MAFFQHDNQNIKYACAIAHFESFENIGIKEPSQILFYLSIKHEADLHYFEKYLKAGKNELTTT
jgi:hypothetical protein